MLRFTATRGRIILAIVFGVGSLLPAPPAQAAATPVSSCPFTATTSVIVTQDLTCNGSDGINVQNANITIDLGGHTLRSDRTANNDGITNFFILGGFEGVTVRNGVLRNFDTGISGGGGSNGMTVENVVVSGNASRGIDITGDDVSIESVTSSGNADTGTDITGDGASVESVTASGNGGHGVEVSGEDISIKTVGASGNSGSGLRLDTGPSVNVASVDASGNGQNGLWITSDFTTMKSVTASGNLFDGVTVQGVSAELASVSGTGNGEIGIRVEVGSHDSVVTKSTASGNDLTGTSAGLFVGGLRPLVSGNRAEGNGFVNSVSNGVGYGLHVPSASSGSVEGNIVRGNDSAAECEPASIC